MGFLEFGIPYCKYFLSMKESLRSHFASKCFFLSQHQRAADSGVPGERRKDWVLRFCVKFGMFCLLLEQVLRVTCFQCQEGFSHSSHVETSHVSWCKGSSELFFELEFVTEVMLLQAGLCSFPSRRGNGSALKVIVFLLLLKNLVLDLWIWGSPCCAVCPVWSRQLLLFLCNAAFAFENVFSGVMCEVSLALC